MHYYFQLSMESECYNDDCKYCDHTTKGTNILISPHFCLALYGWKDDKDKIEPYNETMTDYIIPEKHWVRQ
jgi:hypothetical protein